MKRNIVMVAMAVVVLHASWTMMWAEETKVPVIYFTDLFHPPVDPDDHFDLGCLFALQEFDVKAVIFDNHSDKPGKDQSNAGGRIPLGQMMHITGRQVPWAIGLKTKLRSRDDKALDADAKTQGGIELMMSVLRESPEKSVVIKLSSGCDFAAALNRDPKLFRTKVKAVYLHAGNGPYGPNPSQPEQWEYNVGLDPIAYERVFESGMPIYWCPCFGKTAFADWIGGYQTYFQISNQSAIFRVCEPRVRNYFAYAYAKSTADPIAYLSNEAHQLPGGGRQFWSPPTLAHAAGRCVYQRGESDYVFLTPSAAAQAGLSDKKVDAFEFVPVRATPTRTEGGSTTVKPGSLRVELNPEQPNAVVFHQTNPNYQRILASCLINLFAELGRDNAGNPSEAKHAPKEKK